MKKIIITALMILTIITYNVIPFSVKADSGSVLSHGVIDDDNNVEYGNYWVYGYQADSNGYLDIQTLDSVTIYNNFKTAIVVDIQLNNNYTGYIQITFSSNISNIFPMYYMENTGLAWFDVNQNLMTVHMDNCDRIRLYFLSNNASVNNIQPQYYYPYISKTKPYEYNTLQTLIMIWNGYSDGYTSGQVYNNNLNDLKIFNRFTTAGIQIKDLEVKFTTKNIINGNYVILKYFFGCVGSNVDPSTYYDFSDVQVSYRNPYGSLTILNQYQSNDIIRYKQFVEWSPQRSAYIYTIYVPVTSFVNSNNDTYIYDFRIWGLNLPNVQMVGFMYGGLVDTIPDVDNDNTAAEGIEDIADEFTDITNQEHNITTGFDNNLTNFNNNVNLNDYDFITGISNTTSYFKLQLENVFNQSAALRAMWVIPVICIVLMRLLGG